MKSNKTLTVILILAAFMCQGSGVLHKSEKAKERKKTRETIITIGETILSLLREEKYSEVASRFYIPMKGWTSKEIAEDQKGLQETLLIIRKGLGKLKSYKHVRSAPPIKESHDFIFGGGDKKLSDVYIKNKKRRS